MSENTASDARLRAELLLCLTPGVGPIIRRALLAHFGSAGQVMSAARSELRKVKGVGQKLADALATAPATVDLEAEIRRCEQAHVRIVLDSDEAYPPRLKEIPDSPGVLFIKGELEPADGLAIAIVGTRHATPYGRQQAERLAGGLSRAGYTIVSGLARGIDEAAHQGALAAGGRTLAVLGSGVAAIYPPENAPLAERIIRQGALLSEHPPHAPPLSGTFPQRNRIITGLSLGVIVVEAADRSGALISARHAMEQGREVFAVPGRIDSPVSRGCHQLIRDGARLIECVDDVLDELGPLAQPTPRDDGREVRHPAELKLNEIEQAVLDAVSTSATSIDDVVASTQLPVARVLSTVSVLEMKRLVRRLSGNQILRV